MKKDYDVLAKILEKNYSIITVPVRQLSHLLLASLIVIGTLMIIPAIVQTAAAYIWARQCKKMRVIRGKTNDTSKIPDYDKNLFLYRLVACISSLLVILFESSPRLYRLITMNRIYSNISKAIIVFGFMARFFATYLIVVPYFLFFWNYSCTQSPERRHLIIKNIFRSIVWSSIPIFIVGATLSIPMYSLMFFRILPVSFSYIADCIVNNIIPSVVIIFLTIIFLKNLHRNEYGLFYEPLTFLALNLPFVLGNLYIFIMVLAGYDESIADSKFADFLCIAYALYHMSFSGNFVMATIHSIISEIQADKRKRALAFTDETPSTGDNNSRRRNDVITNMQKQFNIAYRWQTNVSDQSNLGEDDEDDYISYETGNSENDAAANKDEVTAKSKRKKTLEDVTMHYNILKNSNHLKKPPKDRKKRSIIDFS